MARRRSRRVCALSLLAACAVLQIGCGELTIRTWINIDPDASGGQVDLGGPPFPVNNLFGGFLSTIVVDTRDLPDPLHGDVVIEQVRIAGSADTIGPFCVWNDPVLGSSGTIVLDLLAESGSTSITLNAMAQSGLGIALNLAPFPIQQQIDLDLGGGLGFDAFLGALETASLEGALAAETTIQQLVDFDIIEAIFTLDLAVSNSDRPPEIGTLLSLYCGNNFFPLQGTSATYFTANPKSSYLLADIGDAPLPAEPIALSSIHAVPGDTLRITRVGTYASGQSELRDGTRTPITGVFSATDVLLDADQRTRVPDAIDAGQDIETTFYLDCFFIFCDVEETDIPEDFNIDPQVDVVVPAGAEFLFVAPHDTADQVWESNSGFGFGVDIEVNP